MFENNGNRTDFEVVITVLQECERIKSSEIEVSEGMRAVDIKWKLDFHSRFFTKYFTARCWV